MMLTYTFRRVTNIGYEKPPPTTKVGITALGGYQAEVHYFLCGLDIIDTIVTDSLAPAEGLEQIRALGVEVVVAQGA